MKNIIWKNNKREKTWELYRKEPEILITRIYYDKGKYELPSSWFGRTDRYNLKSKKNLAGAKAACEKWLSDFIKSIQ